MSNVETLYGLRGANLEAFKRAGDIIEANLRRLDPERVLRSMRRELELARQLGNDPRTIEMADAHVAIAANKLAVAIRLGETQC